MSDQSMPKTEEEWKEKLTPEQYRVLREKGTEAPFNGKLLHETKGGTYECVACGNSLFLSTAKFDSGTGWPSFDQALPGAVTEIRDKTLGMERVEITCTKCGSHLGHVFGDGATRKPSRMARSLAKPSEGLLPIVCLATVNLELNSVPTGTSDGGLKYNCMVSPKIPNPYVFAIPSALVANPLISTVGISGPESRMVK